MESLGNKLQEAREAKGYTLDYISGETNITLRYLEALERENFSVFPGEPYLLGFLKNYGEYLGLDSGELLSLYRAQKIQEQPVPVEQLLHSPSPLPKILAGIFGAILLLGAGGVGYYFISRLPRTEMSTLPAIRSPVEYEMNTSSLERRFYPGDTILIPSGEDQYKLELSNLGEAVTVSTPEQTVLLDLGQELTLDLNQDGQMELRITAMDFVKNEPSSGVSLRFDLEGFYPVIGEPESPDETGLAGVPEVRSALPGTGLVNAATLYSSPDAYPFTAQLSFQGPCMLRWEIQLGPNRWGNRNERYFQRSEELTISSPNGSGIRVWASNAQSAKSQIIVQGRTVPLELGAAGEVVVAEIYWLPRDTEGRRRLVIIRLE